MQDSLSAIAIANTSLEIKVFETRDSKAKPVVLP